MLLDDLGFDAALMCMDPGHCCVRVELPEGSFHAVVGYAAPIFQAYPLFESFSLDTHRELVTNPKAWADWKAKLPVIINAVAATVAKSQHA